MTEGLAIGSLAGVVLIILGALVYLGRNAHSRGRNSGTAGSPYSPGDPGSASGD